MTTPFKEPSQDGLCNPTHLVKHVISLRKRRVRDSENEIPPYRNVLRVLENQVSCWRRRERFQNENVQGNALWELLKPTFRKETPYESFWNESSVEKCPMRAFWKRFFLKRPVRAFANEMSSRKCPVSFWTRHSEGGALGIEVEPGPTASCSTLTKHRAFTSAGAKSDQCSTKFALQHFCVVGTLWV